MKDTKSRASAEGPKGRKLVVGLMVALVMLGAAATAGPALGKKETGGSATLMAVDAFIWFRLSAPDVTGPSIDWIDVESWSWGVSQSASGGGGGGTGKASFQDFHFTKALDSSSPKWVKACATGQHIKKATFEGVSMDKKGNQTKYLEIVFEDILVSSFQTGGSSGSDQVPTESITLNYAKITFVYVGPDPALRNSFTYDLKEGTSG